MAIKLFKHQLDALNQMKNGCILCGGVGSGKSITSLGYYYLQEGGALSFLTGGAYTPMNDPPRDLYIITTARKRDTLEWEGELIPFLLSTKKEGSIYANTVAVDSWNNIKKYATVKNSFFIFDEQRVVGKGSWVTYFLKIVKSNNWILLSATPGDTWEDYVPVFIANGFYKNRTEFNRDHVVFSRFSKFPKIDRYLDTTRLSRLRRRILVTMDFKRETVAHHEDIYISYSVPDYKKIMKDRWNIWENEPIENASELCYSLRRVANSDSSRLNALIDIVHDHPKAIVFYNFDYELDLIKDIFQDTIFEVTEWNGHKHQPISKEDHWIYLVQYNAGAEGWNCIITDTIIFYSQNYSYKVMIQAAGRIDRLNTPFTDLHYYHLKSRSSIDLAIGKALTNKKKFNESGFVTAK